MLKLAQSSGTVIYEQENKLYISKQPVQWTATAIFVTGLLAFVLLANGFLQLFFFDSNLKSTAVLAIVFLAVGILFAVICWRIIAYRKKSDRLPINELNCICIIDLTTNNLLDAQQNLLAPLTAVQLVRKMQFTSSSPELILQWHKNAVTIVQGNPFSGGIAAVEKMLVSKGIRR